MKNARVLVPLLVVAAVAAFSPVARAADGAVVTVTDSGPNYTLANGILTAKIDKRSGSLVSLVYNGIETLDGGRSPGYWSHSAASDATTDAVTINPQANGGARCEVAVRGKCEGRPVGSGPGGSAVADIEIRWSLARGDSGIYTYSSWVHKPEYPFTSVGEAQLCAKLSDDVFDWMTVDANRNMKMLTTYDWNHGTMMNMKEARLMNTGEYKGQVEHKYDYSACQFDTPAWGWSSTMKHVGFWFVNPTIEYLSGGPTKVELSAHRDATFTDSLTAPAPPCLLNYWRGSHYGGSYCVINQGEQWSKVIGPFLIYCNAGPTPDAMWKDALARADAEAKQWPYDWVDGVDYPHQDRRAAVSGQLVLNDPGAAETPRMSNLLVGLTWPDYNVSGRGAPKTVDWQLDAKHYEFWTRGDEQGRFTIPNVRAGTYTLHAIADGVLGEFAREGVAVEPGKPLDLGHLEWKPVRYGRQLWDIGIPNRSAKEFFHGDDYWHWGMYFQYAKDFPNDVHYVIGKSDFHKDWNFIQVPHAKDDSGRNCAPTTWTVSFTLPESPRPHGKAILRLALSGSEGTNIAVSVNGKAAGDTGRLPNNSVIHRDSVQGYWMEVDVPFDASLMKPGENDLRLTIPGGNVTSGVQYDYLRLELDENVAPSSR